MRLVRFLLLLAVPLLLSACGEDEQSEDPCRGVTCPRGFDCRAGQCVERPEPDPPAGCEVNSDCFQNPGGPFCDRGSGVCVACLDDDHCGARSCVSGGCHGTFCSADAECGAPTPYCNAAGDACVACRDGADCGGGEACEAGACVEVPVECTTDAECEDAAPERPLCRVEDGRGLCVECRRASDCAGGVDCLGGACIDLSCEGDADCAAFPDRSACGGDGRCVGCEGDGDCPAGQACVAEVCLAEQRCASDDDCTGSAEGSFCDPGSGACVLCVDDGDCAVGERCSATTGCEPGACDETADCPPGSRCDDGACVDPGPCGSAADCAFDPRTPQCNGGGACVECTADAHCGAGERCLGDACVVPQECSSDSQCRGGYVCNGGLCGACRTNAQCPRGVCSAGACVNEASCASDVECATGVCAGGSCAPCSTTLDCTAGLWCDADSFACVPPPTCTTTADCGPGRSCDAGSCSAPACDGAEEPNESPAQATPIAPGAPISRTLCANDVDWFVFAAAQGASLNAGLLAPPAGTTLTLAWYDPATRELRSQDAIGGKLQVRALAPAAQGRYFLRVQAAAGSVGGYGLLVSSTAGGGACTDALEPNDSRTTFKPVGMGWMEGLLLCGDDDFYSVDVPAGRALQAFVFPEGNAPANVEIFTTAGTRLASGAAHSWLGGGQVASAAADAAARTLLVKVSKAPPASLPYALFLGDGTDPACGAAPALIAAGADRGRVESSTLGKLFNVQPGACGGGGPDVAFRVHVGASSRLVAQVRAAFPARLSLRNASCTGAEIACGAALASGVGVLDIPQIDPGDYTLVVGGTPGSAGLFELAAQLLPPAMPPFNDRCADALQLDLSGGRVLAGGSTGGARSDGTFSCAPGAPEVYYGFSLAQAGRVVIDLQASGAASLALVDAASCAGEQSCAGPERRPRIDRQLPAGDYVVAVAAASGLPVGFTLRIDVPAPVPNDACAQATSIAVGGTVSGDTTWAANDLSFPLAESCTSYFTGGPEAFHSVVLAAGQRITATVTPGQGYDAALYVIGGCAAAQCLAGVDAAFEGGAETLAFTAPSAGTYRLVVDGSSGGGSYTLRVQ